MHFGSEIHAFSLHAGMFFNQLLQWFHSLDIGTMPAARLQDIGTMPAAHLQDMGMMPK